MGCGAGGYMSAATAPAIEAETTNVVSEETNRIKGFLGAGADEVTSVAQVLAPGSIAWVKSLTDAELFPLGERALQDIADDIIVLDEIRQRFRLAGGGMRGYSGWKQFVEKNSRYTMRTIQRRLNEVNGVRPYTTRTIEPPTPNEDLGWRPTKPVFVPRGLEETNPEVARRVQAGSLVLRPTKTKVSDKNPYRGKDYFARVGRGLAAAFSDVDERLNDIARIKKGEWTPEAKEGLQCIILNLKEVSKKADDYAARLKFVLRKNA
jgi:hypothetical protein